jgi:hypothetical protein
MRAERAWFLFRGERSPNGREIPRWGIYRVTNPVPFPSEAISILEQSRLDTLFIDNVLQKLDPGDSRV